MKRFFVAASLCIGLVIAFGLFFVVNDGLAQGVVPRRIERPNIPTKAKIGKADLTAASARALHEKEEAAYWGQCVNCWRKVGALNLPTMSAKLKNAGGLNAPACKAKLAWQSAKPPYQKEFKIVNIPAIAKGETKLVTINVPQEKYFQLAKPITLTLDYNNSVAEGDENNNVLSYTFNQ